MSLLLLCRPGYEPDLAAECTARAAAAGVAGYARATRGAGWIVFAPASPDAFDALDAALPFDRLVFARQKLALLAELTALPPHDRIAPLLAALPAAMRWGGLVVEHSDSDAGRPLAALCRSFGNALRAALRDAGRLRDTGDDAPWLHAVFLAGDHLLLAQSRPHDRSPWPGGIPRVRVPRGAPSRSAAKLEEALLTLLTTNERERSLSGGRRAVDLGAAPGGWSVVLARHGLRVTAVDNGMLAESALATGLIDHVRADGFTWQPRKPVDWLVCDMVEQPRRVAARMAQWFAHGWCRHAVFNLKLPMKKRWDEVARCLEDFVAQAGDVPPHVRARQLYHDRDEITVFATRAPSGAASSV